MLGVVSVGALTQVYAGIKDLEPETRAMLDLFLADFEKADVDALVIGGDSSSEPDVLDSILELYVEEDRTASEIIELGHDEALVRRITRLVDVNEYKRRQTPPGVRVSVKAFGKDRRLPITNAYRG